VHKHGGGLGIGNGRGERVCEGGWHNLGGGSRCWAAVCRSGDVKNDSEMKQVMMAYIEWGRAWGGK